MPVKFEDRPIAKIREETIDQLVVNYAHDEITQFAFEERLDKAMDTEDREVLKQLVEDLELPVDRQYQETKAEKLSTDEDFFEAGEVDNAGTEKIVRVFSSETRSGPWEVGKEIHVISIASDFTLDFSDAIFRHSVVRIKFFSLLTSDTIYVSEGVRLTSNVTVVLGSVNHKETGIPTANSPSIIIEGKSILSSLNIKIRESLKDKWLSFAAGVKDLFG